MSPVQADTQLKLSSGDDIVGDMRMSTKRGVSGISAKTARKDWKLPPNEDNPNEAEDDESALVDDFDLDANSSRGSATAASRRRDTKCLESAPAHWTRRTDVSVVHGPTEYLVGAGALNRAGLPQGHTLCWLWTLAFRSTTP